MHKRVHTQNFQNDTSPRKPPIEVLTGQHLYEAVASMPGGDWTGKDVCQIVNEPPVKDDQWNYTSGRRDAREAPRLSVETLNFVNLSNDANSHTTTCTPSGAILKMNERRFEVKFRACVRSVGEDGECCKWSLTSWSRNKRITCSRANQWWCGRARQPLAATSMTPATPPRGGGRSRSSRSIPVGGVEGSIFLSTRLVTKVFDHPYHVSSISRF